MGLKAEQRQKMILELVQQRGKVEVNDLAAELEVTDVTIRRDLARMSREKLIKKTYGGAVLNSTPELTISVRYRQIRNITAKKMIGKLAAGLIDDGDIIFLEAGSTCYEIIPYLADKKDLTVIVNSLYLMSRLATMPQHKVILTGGQYRPRRMDMVGPTAVGAIAQLSGFKAFTGADDISRTAGISGADVVTVTFAKLICKRASEVIFVGDHSKFDNPALYKIADLNQLDWIVTDKRPSKQWLVAAKENGVKIVCPKS